MNAHVNAQMNAQEWLKACHADLDRLLPYWLGLPEEEREWHLQRWMDQLEKQPESLPHFSGALLQRVAACESDSPPSTETETYHLCRALLHALAQIATQIADPTQKLSLN